LQPACYGYMYGIVVATSTRRGGFGIIISALVSFGDPAIVLDERVDRGALMKLSCRFGLALE
jgi:hypothetical protein